MGPEALKTILSLLPQPQSRKEVLVGLDIIDDAGIYQISEDQALVQTIDFFTPIVDDGRDFGRIAAANALSDLYAMGAEPITALNVVCFPSQKIPLEILGEILNGGQEKVEEAGAVLIGGHTVDDDEPKYGLSATGLIHPRRIIKKGGARPGDVLVMTKPIGAGILSTGVKGAMVEEKDIQNAVEIMATLNRAGAKVLNFDTVNAMTDITGFGLMGHLFEMMEASGTAARLIISSDWFIAGSEVLAQKGVVPGGTLRNIKFLENNVNWNNTPRYHKFLLCDAMTSGGLLAAVKPEKVESVIKELEKDADVPSSIIVGEVIVGEPMIEIADSKNI